MELLVKISNINNYTIMMRHLSFLLIDKVVEWFIIILSQSINIWGYFCIAFNSHFGQEGDDFSLYNQLITIKRHPQEAIDYFN